VKLLLDTQIAIWLVTASHRLSQKALGLVAGPSVDARVSAVTIWEIAIKHALAKPTSPPFSGTAAIGHFTKAGLTLLDISPEHAAAVGTLPLLHGDPFDRLLVAQALTEPMRLLTADRKIAAYSDTVILC
jgi:PIN domain nuclease of toxin-antitoxin system